MPARRKLTQKQRLFAAEFLVDGNASAAARRAGYSLSTANAAASICLKNPKIQARIAWHHAERMERVQLTIDDVQRGLIREATREDEGSSHAARVAAWLGLARMLGALGTTTTTQRLAEDRQRYVGHGITRASRVRISQLLGVDIDTIIKTPPPDDDDEDDPYAGAQPAHNGPKYDP